MVIMQGHYNICIQKEDVKLERPPISVFNHLKKKAKASFRVQSSCKPLPIPFDLPVNYPQNVMEGLKKQILNGKAFTRFIMSITSAMFRYTAYPTTPEYEHVVAQVVNKYPFLKCRAGKKKDTVSGCTYSQSVTKMLY